MQRQQKKKIIKKHAQHKNDTGSPQVQVAVLTERIKQLTDHLKGHKKDNHSRKGLILMVGKRRRMLNYMKGKFPEAYEKAIAKLELRK